MGGGVYVLSAIAWTSSFSYFFVFFFYFVLYGGIS